MNHDVANTAFGNVLTILFILGLLVVVLKLLLVVLRKGVRLIVKTTALVRRRDLERYGRVRAMDKHDWHRWFAWRPVYVQPYDSKNSWVGRHWVWLKRVERRVEPWGWKARAYRKRSRVKGHDL
jgi:hypothetical protein